MDVRRSRRSSLAPAAFACASLAACDRPDATAPRRPSIEEGPATRPARVPERPVARPAPQAIDEGGCVPPLAPVTAPGWSFVGYVPGPALREVSVAGRHAEALVATTTRAVCVSRDWGATWVPALADAGRLVAPTAVALESTHAVVVIAQGTAAEPAAPRVFISHDAGRVWEPLALPAEAGARAQVFTDRKRTVWAVAGTKLWRSDDGAPWQGPRTLPGRDADGVDACGPVLIARVQLARDRYWHRSEDGGSTWRTMRLGHIGIDGGDGTVRCLGWHDVIEAGRGSLPSHWSHDGGRTWERARYDDRARAAARALAEDPTSTDDPPRCASTPRGALVCMDARRLVFPSGSGRALELTAPAGCERVRMLDDRRVLAFGPSCGVYASQDRGGLWRRMSTSVNPERARRLPASGRGGFFGPRAAWRIDDGLWWSEDTGAHWRPVVSPFARSLAWGVFVDRRHGVFARDDGWIVSTRDGGETWTLVLREEVERLASAGPWIMLTTPSRTRSSRDGGETWRASQPFPADVRVDPRLEVSGAQRWIDAAPGVRVTQTGDRIEVTARADSVHRDEVVRGLPAGWEMLGARATRGAVDRILLAGGAVLRRDLAPDGLPRRR